MFKGDYDGAGSFQLEEPQGLHPSGVFTRDFYDKYRPTVALLGIYQKSKVLVVQSSKQGGSGDDPSWLLPQGGVEWGRTIPAALAEEIRQELGLEYTRSRLQELWDTKRLVTIGAYTNTCRPGQEKPKYIVMLAMPISNPGKIMLDSAENARWELAHDQYELRDLLVHTRPVKRLGIYHAICEAHALKMIDWDCEAVIAEMNQKKVGESIAA